MIIGEAVFLLSLVAVLTIVLMGAPEWFRTKSNKKYLLEHAMRDEISRALSSDNHRKLDDLLIMYADNMPANLRKRLETRRDELVIEKDS